MQQALEIVLIAAIIAVQCYFFWITLLNIRIFRTIFQRPGTYRLNKVHILKSDLEKTDPGLILMNLPKYAVNIQSGPINTDEIVSLGLIMQQSANPVNKDINHSVNTYLLRNSGLVPDFNLIKDIADRNSDALEEEIGSTVSVPLYLGLLGTLLGIIFGLFNISDLTFGDPDISKNVMLDMAIPALLGGVKIAMIASFIGLLLTVVHSGFILKNASAENVRNKHSFFTFIQVELLPLLNQNLNDTLFSLQSNLIMFNKDFSHNIQRLDGLMNKNYDALLAQERMMDMLGKMDINEFATANVQTLAQLQTAIKNFGEFNEYVGSINVAIQKTDHVIVRINDLLGRTEGVENVTQRVLSVFEMNHELMRFIKSHFSALDNSRQMIAHSVVEVNEQLTTALDELKHFTTEKVSSIRNIEIEHVDLMNKTYTERWKNPEPSSEMVRIVEKLADNDQVHAAQISSLTGALQDVRDVIVRLDDHLNGQMHKPSIGQMIAGLFQREKHPDEKV